MSEPIDVIRSEQLEFRAGLIDAGVLVATGVDGLYQRSGAFEGVVRGLERLAHAAAGGEGGPQRFLPPIIPTAVFERTGYLRSFPDLLGAVEVFRGGDREHAELLREADDGGDWTRFLEPAEVMLSSAACHSLYATLGSDVPAGGLRFEVQGFCFRHEPSLDPARMQSFRMHEFVLVGSREETIAHRDLWAARAVEVLEGLGLEVEVEPANDPFFGRAGRMLAANQRAEALKFEITCRTSSTGLRTAIASANYHETHFGESFDLHTPDGGTAHSACFGFGLERITLALLRRHGTDVASWPDEVAGRLGL